MLSWRIREIFLVALCLFLKEILRTDQQNTILQEYFVEITNTHARHLQKRVKVRATVFNVCTVIGHVFFLRGVCMMGLKSQLLKTLFNTYVCIINLPDDDMMYARRARAYAVRNSVSKTRIIDWNVSFQRIKTNEAKYCILVRSYSFQFTNL